MPIRTGLLILLSAFSCLAQSALPLRVGPTGRYLVDRAGQPFFLQGDSPWSIITGATPEEAIQYLDARRAQGFNALIVNLVEHFFNGPANRAGEQPFTTPGDLTRPNEKYFAHADWVLQQAAQRGFVVLLNPLYLGYRGTDEGWYQEALLNGPFKVRQYGRWLGKRYRGYSNIIWTLGGDRKADQAREAIEFLGAGIREQAPGHLFTAHAEPELSAQAEYGYAGLDLNGTYTYEIVYKELLREYRRRPVMPNVLFESSYEGEHNASPVQIRRQGYWAVLSGATGQFMGARPLWLFDPGWQAMLQSQGSKDMARIRAFQQAIPWHQLVPDSSHRVVTGGLGELNGLDYLAAAASEDGRVVAAYAPTAREIEIDLGQIKAAKLAGWWFDPVTGQTQALGPIEGGARKQKLTPPFPNDFALVLHDAALAVPAPGR